MIDEYDRTYKLGAKLGQGGQGAVYRVLSDDDLAIKGIVKSMSALQFNDDKDSQESWILQDETVYEKYAVKIHGLMALGIFYNIEHVALPIAMLAKPYCGYVMWLMNGLEEIAKQKPARGDVALMAGKNSGLKKKLLVLRELTLIINKLHANGLIYCDLSLQNVYVSKSPDDHQVWLIDSDNLVFSNHSRRSIGTPGFRAPEIAKRESPNTFYSDMYSFAVVAFWYLTGESPFVNAGAGDLGWDDGWENEISDTIDDGSVDYMYEDDGSKLGIPLDYVSTEKMKQLFYRTLCKEGREHPKTRPTASEWYEALEEALDQLDFCFETGFGDEQNAKRNKKRIKKHEFIGEQCVWCKREGKNADLPERYKISVDPVVRWEDENWENSSPAVRKKYCGCIKYLSCDGSKWKFDIPLKYLTGIDTFPEEHFQIEIKKDQIHFSVGIEKDIIGLYRDHKKFDGKCDRMKPGEKINLTVVCKKGTGKENKTEANFSMERIR